MRTLAEVAHSGSKMLSRPGVTAPLTFADTLKPKAKVLRLPVNLPSEASLAGKAVDVAVDVAATGSNGIVDGENGKTQVDVEVKVKRELTEEEKEKVREKRRENKRKAKGRLEKYRNSPRIP